MGAELGDCIALLADERFSGGSHVFCIGYIAREAKMVDPLLWLRTTIQFVLMQDETRELLISSYE